MSVAKFDRFEDLEDHVVDYLASVTDLKVFGCTVDFLQADTHTYLENPIWEKLQQSTEYTMVFRSCSEVLPSKETFEGCPFRDIPLAVHVPMNLEEMVPEGAFAAVPRLRHVSIEAGIRVVGAEAWQCCRQLRIVRMPASVVRMADNTFRGCQLLNKRLAAWSLATKPLLNAALCSGSVLLRAWRINFVVPPNLGTISFEIASTWPLLSCERLLTARMHARELSQGCLSSTGIGTLELTRAFQVLGAHACDNCQLLKKVDFSNTKIEEIQEFTFVHCTSLCEVRLPYTLHTIRVKAFMNCTALPD